ncbi:TPA: glycosyltransferase [Candidatus Woesearchaeota archaeon]|nr:glycosyltransferase [Candidatus Woesearchaeota archaeon]
MKLGSGGFELSLVVPTYNEREHIRDTVLRMLGNLKKEGVGAELVFVDDSKDGTEQVLDELAREHGSMRVIHRVNARGVGSAIRGGIEAASGKYVVVFMADAPDDIRYVPSILARLREGYHLVHTSRFMKGCVVVGYPLMKTIGNRLVNLGVRVLFLRPDLRDFTSLFKGFDREAVMKLGLEAGEFDVGIEIALKSIRKGYRVVEVPVSWYERSSGKSKLKLSKQGPVFIRRILKIFFMYW